MTAPTAKLAPVLHISPPLSPMMAPTTIALTMIPLTTARMTKSIRRARKRSSSSAGRSPAGDAGGW